MTIHVDPEYGKPFDNISAMAYILSHPRALNQFLSKFKKSDSVKIAAQFLREEPTTLANLLKHNYETSESTKLDTIVDMLSEEGTFTICLGLPGGGKTGLGVFLTEKMLAEGMKVYWFGYSPALARAYPEIEQTFNIRKIENGVLFYDEVLLTLFGRMAMQREVQERVLKFPFIRHRGIAVFMMSQTEQFDVTLKNMLTYVLFKPFVISGVFQRKMVFRPYVGYLIPHQKNENLLYNMSNNECIIFNNPLPARWSDDISKSMSPIKDIGQAKFYAKMLTEAGISDRELPTFLEQRNVDIESVSEELDILSCPKCGSIHLQRYGTRGGKQRWRCTSCEHLFDEHDKRD